MTMLLNRRGEKREKSRRSLDSLFEIVVLIPDCSHELMSHVCRITVLKANFLFAIVPPVCNIIRLDSSIMILTKVFQSFTQTASFYFRQRIMLSNFTQQLMSLPR